VLGRISSDFRFEGGELGMGEQQRSGRKKIEQLSVAIQTIAKRMDAQFVLDDAKVESFMEANQLKEDEDPAVPLST
jgi:hypothetical protein